ncbi:hypothetical protein LCGC14_0303440 [marine sediment metagenome]|uniref:Uncharacterized protein n=1 Tax=marine sediment metagenome TaxID=412755 RepID=A0A0F9WVV5_9ZZZZ
MDFINTIQNNWELTLLGISGIFIILGVARMTNNKKSDFYIEGVLIILGAAGIGIGLGYLLFENFIEPNKEILAAVVFIGAVFILWVAWPILAIANKTIRKKKSKKKRSKKHRSKRKKK